MPANSHVPKRLDNRLFSADFRGGWKYGLPDIDCPHLIGGLKPDGHGGGGLTNTGKLPPNTATHYSLHANAALTAKTAAIPVRTFTKLCVPTCI